MVISDDGDGRQIAGIEEEIMKGLGCDWVGRKYGPPVEGFDRRSSRVHINCFILSSPCRAIVNRYGGATVVTAILIDDSLTIQKLLERLTAGKATIAGRAKDGFTGFDLFKQTRPDIVFLDITMPNCGGKECLKMILDLDRNACVIMVSSLGDQATMQECLDIGARAFLKKEELATGDPESKQKLHALIEQLVQPQESRAA